MNLDQAFKKAIKKFYEGAGYGNVDKYSKRPFEYGFNELDAIHKKLKGKSVVDEELTEEVDNESSSDDDLEEEDLMEGE